MSADKDPVSAIWKQVRKEREERTLTNFLANYEERIAKVLADAKTKSHSKRFRKLRRIQRSREKSPASSAKQASSSKKRSSTSASVVKTLNNAEEAVPRQTGRLQILYSYPVEDQTELAFVPSDISEAPEQFQEKYHENFDLDAREAAIARGPIHHVQEVDQDVQETIRRCFQKLSLSKDALMDHVKQVTNLEADRVERLFDETVAASTANLNEEENNAVSDTASSPPTRKKNTEMEKKGSASKKLGDAERSSAKKSGIGGSASKKKGKSNESMLLCQPVHDTLVGHDPDYLKLMDSFRMCYCSRCKIFDCLLHGVTESPSLQLSYEVGMAKENDIEARDLNSKQRKGKEVPPKQVAAAVEDDQPRQHHYDDMAELTAFHKTMCRRFYLIFEGNTKDMSIAMQAPEHLIKQFVEEEGWEFPKETLLVKRPPRTTRPPRRETNSKYYLMKNYRQPWLDAISEAGLRSTFQPCAHDESCEALDQDCSCVKSSVYCTSACAWNTLSRNFFRGCDCAAHCTVSSCSCRAMHRECDPDLCNCGETCTDPPHGSTWHQRCQNDSITMRRDVEIAIAKSSIEGAGWGAFARTKFGKGEFIGEYVGEIITQEEADRRGQLYDINNHSSLFTVSSDHTIDADRKGNLLRYLNHSYAPNVEQRQVTVNGDHRMGFFAKTDIEPQTELCFDYGSCFSVLTKDGKTILKSSRAIPWIDSSPDKTAESKDSKKASPKKKRPRL